MRNHATVYSGLIRQVAAGGLIRQVVASGLIRQVAAGGVIRQVMAGGICTLVSLDRWLEVIYTHWSH